MKGDTLEIKVMSTRSCPLVLCNVSPGSSLMEVAALISFWTVSGSKVSCGWLWTCSIYVLVAFGHVIDIDPRLQENGCSKQNWFLWRTQQKSCWKLESPLGNGMSSKPE